MSTLDELCKQAVDSVDGATACAVIERGSHRVLASFGTCEPNPLLATDIAKRAAQLIERPTPPAIAEAVRAARRASSGSTGAACEMQLRTADDVLLARAISDDGAFVVLVTDQASNLGLRWAQFRNAIAAFARPSM